MFFRSSASDDRSPWGNFFFQPIGMRSASGLRVTADNAMRLAAVYACVGILTKCFALLPFGLYRKRSDGGRDAVTDHPLWKLFALRPNAFQNPFEWRQMLMGHLALRGNFYNRIITGADGSITDLIPLHPDRVRPESLPNGEYRYRVKDQAGNESIVTRGDIWHMRWLSSDGIVGISPIDAARETIGIGLASQEYGARFFLNDARPGGGWIEHPAQFKDKTARENFRSAWQESQAASNRHKTAVLEAGMKYHDLPVNNEQAQFLETRKFSVSDIARIFGVPPHLIADLEKATFSNIEQQSIEFVQFTMAPIGAAWCHSIAYSLLEDDSGLEPDFGLERLLRGDFAARGEFYNKLFQVGALSTNDIRIREGDNPVPNGDQRFVPVNLQTLENAAAPPQPAAAGSPGEPPKARAGLETTMNGVLMRAIERVQRKEFEIVKGGTKCDDEKLAQFVVAVLGVPIEAARAYCAGRNGLNYEQRTMALRALVMGEVLTCA